MAETAQTETAQARPPVEVLYCAVCSFPPEYCEFGSHFSKCKEWLLESHPDLYQQYYSEDALQRKMGTLSIAAQEKIEQEAAKKEAKAAAKADAAHKKMMASQIIIKRVERNKRKHVTTIHGLDAFGIDLKKAAKSLAQKFATGASVAKNPQGLDEVVVQGDVADEISDMIKEGSLPVLKGVPGANVEIVEEKKKKGPE